MKFFGIILTFIFVQNNVYSACNSNSPICANVDTIEFAAEALERAEQNPGQQPSTEDINQISNAYQLIAGNSVMMDNINPQVSQEITNFLNMSLEGKKDHIQNLRVANLAIAATVAAGIAVTAAVTAAAAEAVTAARGFITNGSETRLMDAAYQIPDEMFDPKK